jgi:hypothetical protein
MRVNNPENDDGTTRRDPLAKCAANAVLNFDLVELFRWMKPQPRFLGNSWACLIPPSEVLPGDATPLESWAR